ncbi:hypothetical protein GG344DRAFT_65757 [Lentinula edodes]|nr:hypothetical protein GG344DRAFT_65757 [Lentinula edodes]
MSEGLSNAAPVFANFSNICGSRIVVTHFESAAIVPLAEGTRHRFANHHHVKRKLNKGRNSADPKRARTKLANFGQVKTGQEFQSSRNFQKGWWKMWVEHKYQVRSSSCWAPFWEETDMIWSSTIIPWKKVLTCIAFRRVIEEASDV